MLHLYNLVLLLLLALLSPFLLFKILTTSKYREDFLERLGIYCGATEAILSGAERPIWYHGASVGEINASAGLIKKIKDAHPELKLIVSTYTTTGKKMARDKLDVDAVILFPLDLKWIVSKALKKIRPSMLILMETELWPNMIAQTAAIGAETLVVNARISSGSYRGYRMIKPLLSDVFKKITAIMAQSDANRDRLIALGADPKTLCVTGNIKFDVEISAGAFDFMDALDGPLIVAASVHSGEDAMIADIYIDIKKEFADLKLLVAPRHLDKLEALKRMLTQKGIHYVKRSSVKTKALSDVIILDTHGELASMCQYGDLVFVGGSMIPHGGQNPLEAALYGKPSLFGPHMFNFAEITEILTTSAGAVSVKDSAGLKQWILKLLRDEKLRQTMGNNARNALLGNQGVTDKTAKKLLAHIAQIKKTRN